MFVFILHMHTRGKCTFILKASVVTCYIMFLTWSALVNIPELACNPTERSHNVTVVLANGTATTQVTADLSFSWQTGVSLAILLVSVVYACIRTSSHSSVSRLTFAVSWIVVHPYDVTLIFGVNC